MYLSTYLHLRVNRIPGSDALQIQALLLDDNGDTVESVDPIPLTDGQEIVYGPIFLKVDLPLVLGGVTPVTPAAAGHKPGTPAPAAPARPGAPAPAPARK